jgi:hypothetical protein
LTDNCLLSVTDDNDLSRVARSNTATGGDTLPISNETRSRTDNCLPSRSNGDNDVSLAARGNTDISQKKRKKSALCKWTERECSNFAQSNPKRFCGKHYTAWLSIQAGGSGAPAINNNTIGCGGDAGGGGAPAINNDTISREGEAGGSGSPAALVINNDTLGHEEQTDDSY